MLDAVAAEGSKWKMSTIGDAAPAPKGSVKIDDLASCRAWLMRVERLPQVAFVRTTYLKAGAPKAEMTRFGKFLKRRRQQIPAASRGSST